jgi:Ni2+-binding GTPase involved in maturation of urease and hydrogenase
MGERQPRQTNQKNKENPEMAKIKMILVGGFLGAGKTTLLAQAARRFAHEGKRVGMITNDQAKELVDTGLLKGEGFDVQEVAGGCFCCRFRCFMSVADGIIEQTDAEVLLGEPVGSCTDLSATVLQPLKEYYGKRYDVAAFTVLADPDRLREAIDDAAQAEGFPPEVLYIYRKQLEEADIIAINKADTLAAAQVAELKAALTNRFPGRPVIAISALTGDGVDEWMALINATEQGGRRITDVDYDTYATGEAVLGWLNATARLGPQSPAAATDWRHFMLEFMANILARCRMKNAQIAHLKLLLDLGKSSLVANLTGNGQEAMIRGEADASAAGGLLTINARVHISPDDLKAIVAAALESIAAQFNVRADIQGVESFSPGRPQPEHRYAKVV